MAIFYGFNEGHIFVSIAGLIERDGAGHSFDGDTGQSIANCYAISGISSLDSFEHCEVGIIAQSGDGRDDLILVVFR